MGIYSLDDMYDDRSSISGLIYMICIVDDLLLILFH